MIGSEWETRKFCLQELLLTEADKLLNILRPHATHKTACINKYEPLQWCFLRLFQKFMQYIEEIIVAHKIANKALVWQNKGK